MGVRRLGRRDELPARCRRARLHHRPARGSLRARPVIGRRGVVRADKHDQLRGRPAHARPRRRACCCWRSAASSWLSSRAARRAAGSTRRRFRATPMPIEDSSTAGAAGARRLRAEPRPAAGSVLFASRAGDHARWCAAPVRAWRSAGATRSSCASVAAGRHGRSGPRGAAGHRQRLRRSRPWRLALRPPALRARAVAGRPAGCRPRRPGRARRHVRVRPGARAGGRSADAVALDFRGAARPSLDRGRRAGVAHARRGAASTAARRLSARPRATRHGRSAVPAARTTAVSGSPSVDTIARAR